MKRLVSILSVFLLLFSFAACTGGKKPSKVVDLYEFINMEMFDYPGIREDNYKYNFENNIIDDNYRNYYEILVGTFCDSDGDKMGDFNGVRQKLDYISELGFNGIWLMPIFPSPTYHKYDATDYYAVDSDYGTMADFENLLAACKERGIKVIMDFAINHTSSLHPWFLEAKAAVSRGDLNNRYVPYYNFSRSSGRGYHAIGNGWFYEGVFYDGMPDLNLDHPEVRQEIQKVAKFWLDKGVGGFRYDAAKHIYESDNDKNVEYFTELNAYCKSVKSDFYAVAEVWDNEVVVGKYYASGMSSFNYPFGGTADGTYLKTVTGSTANTYVDKLIAWQGKIREKNPDAIDAPFLTNHDNARVANVLYRSLEALKMAASLYLMSPGSTFTYYGEEIGMLSHGSSDPNKRMPMYWSSDASKLTDRPTGAEQFEQFFPPVDVQEKYTNSLLATYKRALAIRNQNPEIARGTLTKIENEQFEDNICAYKSTYNGSSVIVVHNLRKEPVTLNLAKSTFGYSEIRGYLTGTSEDFYIQGESFMFPAYSTLILK